MVGKVLGWLMSVLHFSLEFIFANLKRGGWYCASWKRDTFQSRVGARQFFHPFDYSELIPT